MKQLLIITMVFTIISCSRFSGRNNEEPIARAYDKYLYLSDLKNIFPAGVSPSDSVIIIKNFINKWVRQQLILNKAELNLSDDQKDVEKQLEDYRASLIIFKYEQLLIKEKLDTVVYQEEIQKYYEENASNFNLNKNAIKALFVKVPVSSPNIGNVRYWYRSDNDEDLVKLEQYCNQYNAVCNYFNDDWIYFEDLLKNIPVEMRNEESFLKWNRQIDTRDSLYYYFVKVRDYKLKGDITPLNLVKENIRNIILKKRKHAFISNLENGIYNDALNRGEFNVY